uniref:Uncharacterized protein n=1 Tax=Aegilops tauschii subsp. strangulata TaxID=200361 RepID=A0A453MFF1_AEGTS
MNLCFQGSVGLFADCLLMLYLGCSFSAFSDVCHVRVAVVLKHLHSFSSYQRTLIQLFD